MSKLLIIGPHEWQESRISAQVSIDHNYLESSVFKYIQGDSTFVSGSGATHQAKRRDVILYIPEPHYDELLHDGRPCAGGHLLQFHAFGSRNRLTDQILAVIKALTDTAVICTCTQRVNSKDRQLHKHSLYDRTPWRAPRSFMATFRIQRYATGHSSNLLDTKSHARIAQAVALRLQNADEGFGIYSDSD